jgi:DNA invertase Pin-like site-specific DNA recombinase
MRLDSFNALPLFINQDFQKILLTNSVNRLRRDLRLRARQYDRPDTRCSAKAAPVRRVRQDLPREAERRELLKLLKAIEHGDVVTVTRIDRVACSTFDLFAIVKRIVDAGAQFRSLAEPWADTATSTGRLMIAVLGGLADVERDLIRTRTAEGRSRAKARGQHMGRPPALTPQQQAEARKRRDEGAALKELAQSYNVGLATIFRLSKKAAA